MSAARRIEAAGASPPQSAAARGKPNKATVRRNVAIVGDSSLEAKDERLALAESLGAALVGAGYNLVCGGLGGIMDAACRGGHSCRKRSGSIIGILPGHSAAAASRHVDIALPTGLDVARNTIVAHADAVIGIGGGSGTLSELALAWQLNRLTIAYRVAGWSGVLADTRLDGRSRYPELPEDRVFGVSSADEALKLLQQYLPRYEGFYLGISYEGLRG